MLVLRSVLFNIAVYFVTLVLLVVALPTFLMTYRSVIWVAKTWTSAIIFLLRVICDIRVEYRGATRAEGRVAGRLEASIGA